MKIGQSAEVRRTFSADDVAEYERLSGHTASPSEVPEPMIGALFSYLLGVKLPGRGTNYLKQESEYLTTASVGQELIARVEISRLRPDKQLVDLQTSCKTSRGITVCEGRALVFVGDVES